MATTDLPQFQPGPAWLHHFKPGLQRPGPPETQAVQRLSVNLVGNPGPFIPSPGVGPITAPFGQPTTAGNLLIAWLGTNTQTSADPFTCSTPGWREAVSANGYQVPGAANIQAAIWYKPNCNASEPAPVFNNAGGPALFVQVAEFSGLSQSFPLDKWGSVFTPNDFSGHTFSSVTAYAPDQTPGDLIVSAFARNPGGSVGSDTETITDGYGTPLAVTAYTNENNSLNQNFTGNWAVASPYAVTRANTATSQIPVSANVAGVIASFSAQPNPPIPDQPQVQPGPTWFELFKPQMPRPRQIAPVFPSVGGRANFLLGSTASVPSVVQTAGPVQVQSLTGPLTATFGSPTGGSGRSSLVALITTNGSTLNPVPSSITLGGSNDNWRIAYTQPGTGSASFGGFIWYDPSCAAGQTAVQANFTAGTGASGDIYLTVFEVTGNLVYDQGTSSFASAPPGSSHVWSSGAPAALSFANEISFGACTAGNQVPVASGSWTTVSTGVGQFDQLAGYLTTSTGTPTAFSGVFTGANTSFAAVTASFYSPSTALQFTANGGATSPDLPQALPGPTWFDLFKPGMPRPRQLTPPPEFPSVGATGSFSLAPLAFTAQGGQTSPDFPQILPGSTWFDLFKPGMPRPKTFTPDAGPQSQAGVTSTGSFALAPLAFTARGGATSPDLPQVLPGTTWFRLFKPGLWKPVPPLPARDQVSTSGSFSLAPLGFAANAGQSSPDFPQILPGPVWFDLFKPQWQKPRPIPPAIQSVGATGSFALAPLAFSAAAGQSSPDQPQVLPGPFWLRLFKTALYKPLPPPPAFQSVNATGSFTLAPLAFSATAGQSSPDVPQVNPGTTWLSLFKREVPKPRPVPPARDQVSTAGSFSLAPLAFSATGAETSPDLPQALPGPVWYRLFKPAVPKPVPWQPYVPFVGVGVNGNFALAPLGFSAQGAQTSPDLPQIYPGPVWFDLFKPQWQKPRPIVPIVGPVTSTGSFSLAPLGFSAQAGQSSPDVPSVLPGAYWFRLFKPWVQRPVPPQPARDQVSILGSFALAPLAFSAQAGQSSPDQPQVRPGPLWLKLFRPWITRSVPPPPATQGVTSSGSFALAPLAFAGTGTVTAATNTDIPVVQPGPVWFRLFKPWVQRPPQLPVSNTGILPPVLPAPRFRYGVIHYEWTCGSPQQQWNYGVARN